MDYDFNVKGVLEINSPEGVMKITTSGLQEMILRISAINVLRREGKSVKAKIKGDKALEQLIQKISGDIEIISHKAIG